METLQFSAIYFGGMAGGLLLVTAIHWWVSEHFVWCGTCGKFQRFPTPDFPPALCRYCKAADVYWLAP